MAPRGWSGAALLLWPGRSVSAAPIRLVGPLRHASHDHSGSIGEYVAWAALGGGRAALLSL